MGVVHGALCTSPVCIVSANSGAVDAVELHRPPPGACLDIVRVTVDLQRSFFIAPLGSDDIEAERSTLHLAVWHVATGALLKYMDLLFEPAASRLAPKAVSCRQLEVHPRLPLIAMDFGNDVVEDEEMKMEVVAVQFPLAVRPCF